MTAATVLASPSFAPLAVPFGIVLVLIIVRGWKDLARGAPRRKVVTAVAGIVVFTVLTATFAIEGAVEYARANAYRFDYVVSVMSNGSDTASAIVPVVADERLLFGIIETGYLENWSLTSTPYGPGLYLRFAGYGGVAASYARFPPPNPAPNVSLTLRDPTGPDANRVWVYFTGAPGGRLDMRVDDCESSYFCPSVVVFGWLSPGWNEVQVFSGVMPP